MELLDLPTEILDLIVQQYYDPWDICLRKIQNPDQGELKLEVRGYPDLGLPLACRTLYRLAIKAEAEAFSGTLNVDESTPRKGPACCMFMNRLSNTPRYQWVEDRIQTIRIVNPASNPAGWRVRIPLALFPNVRYVELDCRYRFHFAIHNVDSLSNFLSGADGALIKCMDFRRSFFLSCESFFHTATSKGISVTVIRAMGLREGKSKCQAVVAAADYIMAADGNVVIDPNTIKTKAAPIYEWPQGIQAALGRLKSL